MKEVILVSMENCTYCRLAIEYFNFNKIPYRVVDYRLFAKFKEDGHKTVPQLYVADGSDYSLLIKDGYNGLVDMSPEGVKELLAT